MTRDFDLLWDYSKPAETEAKFRQLLPRQSDPDARLELLTQIARCQGLQRQFDQAHKTLDQVEGELGAEPSRAKVRYLLERGRVFNSSGEKERAKSLFEDAWSMGKLLQEEFFAVDAAHMNAIADPDQAIEWNLRAMEIAEGSQDERTRNWVGSLYNNLGWAQHDQGECERALASFQKALAERVCKKDREQILVARWCVARCLRSLGRVEEALQIQRDLLAARELDQNPDGFVSEEIAECLLHLGKEEEARPHFAKAFQILSRDEGFKSGNAERLERIRRYGSGEQGTA